MSSIDESENVNVFDLLLMDSLLANTISNETNQSIG